MQASFWSQLNRILPPKTRRMFIEPRLAFRDRGVERRLYPDVVIGNTRTAIAVVELKYLPRAQMQFAKDLESMRIISQYRGDLAVENDRFRGTRRDPKSYPFANSVLFVWAGVHRPGRTSYESPEVPVFSANHKELAGCFLQLHAETHARDAPRVFTRSG